MPDDVKAPEAPVVTPEAPADESFIDKRRQEVENRVITENESFPEPELLQTPEPPKVEKPAEEVKVQDDSDPVERIKKLVQKRIDKVVAQKKSAEEELAETRLELERLRANPKTPETLNPKDNTPPTPEQVKAYVTKMREEGNHKDADAAIFYLLELEKGMALKELEEKQTKAQREAETAKERQLNQWIGLQKDYEDASNPELNLSNQKSLLYTTALSLYQDKELHKDFYDDPDVMNGFRRAVADAYREIHQQGLIKQSPKVEPIIPRSPRMALADPSAETIEESAAPSNSALLSDAEKVREEIRNRNKNRFKR